MNKKVNYSEEFTDTINRFPQFNNILLYSLLVIIIIAFTLLYFIKSPEIVMGEAKVTAEKPPIELVSQNYGKIIIKEFIPHKFFKKGTFLAVIENPANEEDIFKLKSILQRYQNKIFELKFSNLSFATNSRLGEIQEQYLNLLNIIYALENSKKHNEYEAKKIVLNEQIGKYYQILNQRKSLKEIKSNDLNILKNKLSEDSMLYSKGLIIKPEFDQSIRNYYREKENLKLYDSKDIENKSSINDNRQNINLLELQKNNSLSDLQMRLIVSYQELNQAINFWESKYVFKVPQDGEVDMMQFITSYQFIKQGEPIFSVLPIDNKVLAQLIIPIEGAGKIKIGQDVVIKLATYPYQEFGKLYGKVKSISLIPTQNYYLVFVDLPNGLKSDTNQNLSFSKNMVGSAEIVTERKSLLSKLFNRISSVFDKKPTNKDNSDMKKKEKNF